LAWSFSEHENRNRKDFPARTGLARDLLIRKVPRRSTVEQAIQTINMKGNEKWQTSIASIAGLGFHR